jgi:hypothetical protein
MEEISMMLFKRCDSDGDLRIPFIGIALVIVGLFLACCLATWKGVRFIAREIVYFADGYPDK